MLFLYGWVTRVDDMTAKGPAMPMKMKTKITWTKWLPYCSHCPYASSLKRRFISIEDKSLCFCERTLCKQRNIWEVDNSRGKNWKPWPSLPVLWVKVGTAADVHPWWGLLLKDLQSYRYGNWAHVAQRESRYWDKQNGHPEEQHCCSRLMWKWHVLEDEFYTLHLLSGSDSTFMLFIVNPICPGLFEHI